MQQRHFGGCGFHTGAASTLQARPLHVAAAAVYHISHQGCTHMDEQQQHHIQHGFCTLAGMVLASIKLSTA
jgi:hypothetical protein